MPSNKTLDLSYCLLLPYLAITNIPVLAIYWNMRYTFAFVLAWAVIAIFKHRQVHLPIKGINNLKRAFTFLILYICLGPLYAIFGIGTALSYERIAGLMQCLIPLMIFHLSICNGCHRELRLLVMYCFGCVAVGALMTWFGESVIEGGSRAITGSSDDAYEAYQEGIGAFGFVYGAGLMVFPLLYGMTFMSVQHKSICSVVTVVIAAAAFKTGYSILIIGMMIAGIIYMAAKVGIKKRPMHLMGVILIAILVIVTARPKTLSFITPQMMSLSYSTKNIEYKTRLVAVADAASGSEDTYVDMRASLYWDSWNVFLKYPIFGSGSGEHRLQSSRIVGGHSTIFDTLGFYGLFGFTIYLLFFICHYRYMRVISEVVIGFKWWPAYYIFIISATAVMFINPFSGVPLLMSLCLYIPALPLLFKREQRFVGIPTVANRPNRFRSQPG